MDISPRPDSSHDLSPQVVSILTTEHYNLQGGRSNTISESNGRASLFLGTVSTTLVALAFVGQAAGFGTPFVIFALILFPTLWFLGIVTFERILQSSIEDVLYARGISRIRHLYLEAAPELQSYLILPSSDDPIVTLEGVAMEPSHWQLLLSLPGTISVITGIIGAVFVGLLLYIFIGLTLILCVITGMIFLLASVAISHRYQWVKRDWANKRLPILFPAPKAG